MRSAISLAVLFVLAAALAAQNGEEGRKPRARELRPRQLRDHVGAYLADPANREKLAELRTKLILDANDLTWDRERLAAVWRVRQRRGVTLTATQRASLEAGLEDRLANIVYQYRGGLIFDAGAVPIQFRVAILPPEEGPAARQPRPEAPPPRPEPRYTWRFVPTPCDPCLAGWYVPVEARPRAPRMAPADEVGRRTTAREDTSFVSLEARSLEARGGAVSRHMPPALDQTGLKAGDAPELYRRGYALYWQGDRSGALPYFVAATRLADDARYWYYRALAERALGNPGEAARSLRRANDLERRGRPRGDVLGLALERVQGPARRWLRDGAAPERVDGR